MAQIIAIANQKGGVGKTTTAVNLAASLSVLKKRVLLVDMDSQGNATTGSGLQKNDLLYSVTDVILGEAPIQTAITKTEVGYKVLGANRDLAGAELVIAEQEGREFILKKALNDIKGDFDYIIVDCAPSLSLITVNALVAVNAVMIPMQCEYYALEGLADLTQTIDRIQQGLNPELEIIGVLRTMFDGRNALSRDVSDELSQFFGKKLYDTVIPRNVRLAEAPAHGLPIIFFEKSSKGAIAYLNLAAEMIQKSKAKVKKVASARNTSAAQGANIPQNVLQNAAPSQKTATGAAITTSDQVAASQTTAQEQQPSKPLLEQSSNQARQTIGQLNHQQLGSQSGQQPSLQSGQQNQPEASKSQTDQHAVKG